MKKQIVFNWLGVILVAISLLSPACKDQPSICIYDEDDGLGAGISVEENDCSPILNDESYTRFMLGTSASGQMFDVDSLVFYLKEQLDGEVKGWQMAVGYEGKVIRAKAGGLRSGSEDCPSNVYMSACQKMNIGSQTKTYVTIAIVKMLHDAKKNPFTEKIADYIPDGWEIKPGVENLTFAHFLGHRNGFSNDIGTSRADLKTWFEQGITGTVGDYDYTNSNIGLMRVLFPRVLEKVTGVPFADEDIDTDEECSAIEVNYIMTHICQPSGNSNHILSWEDDASAVLKFSDANDNDGEFHTVYKTIGAGSMLASVVDQVNMYMHVFDQQIISQPVLDYLVNDAFILGFNQTGTIAPFNSMYYAHGGTLADFLSVTIQLPGQIYVSCAVNSKPCDNNCGSATITAMVRSAYQQAFVN